MAAGPDVSSLDWQWFVVGRWQEYAGEARANLLRIAAVGAFYIIQLVQFYLLGEQSEAAVQFHRAATATAVAWSLLALGVLICLRQRIFPLFLKYVSTLGDVVLLTCLAMAIHGDAAGPNSPLVAIYFLIIAVAALRFSLPLIWCATIACMVAYVAMVAGVDQRDHGAWFDADHVVPVVEQLMILLALGLTGITVGQVIRRVRQLAEEYRRRLSDARETSQ